MNRCEHVELENSEIKEKMTEVQENYVVQGSPETELCFNGSDLWFLITSLEWANQRVGG